MINRIKKAAVLGAGVMGAKIAAHLANAGIEVRLLDIAPRELTADEQAKGLSLHHRDVRNRIARLGLESAKNAQPAAFFTPETAQLITLGNFEDDLPALADADWIIEAVVENLEVKQGLLKKVDHYRRPYAMVTSNTSGLPLQSIAVGLSEDFRRHWLGTHFFNPPRYMNLLEIIPTPETLPEVTQFLTHFCDYTLGKGVVLAKDSPNFIANRIGTLGAMQTIKIMMEDGFTIEEVDKIFGPALGRPKSAVFRTFDLAGLDTFTNVVKNLYQNSPLDEKRDLFIIPPFIEKMVANRWLGDKTGQGFYKKEKIKGVGTQILSLDYNTLEYRPQQKPELAELDAVKNIEDPRERIRALVFEHQNTRVGQFVWKILSEVLVYTANRVPEIADDIVSIDNAMKWGFNWEYGVFETWDALGVPQVVKRLQAEGKKEIPPIVQKLLDSKKKSFYQARKSKRAYFDFYSAEYRPMAAAPGVTILADLKSRNKVVKSNDSASLIDLGDDVAGLEFHSKMNAIGGETLEMMRDALAEVDARFAGLVIGNQGENFCVGANIMLLLMEAGQQNWSGIDMAAKAFQDLNMALRYSPKPVVVAPFGMTFGGGCEITLHGSRVQMAAETYIGLVEVGVGLIPAGGGTKELLLRTVDLSPKGENVDLFPHVKRTFETIGMAKVATSALEARKLGFLRETDGLSMNKARLIEDAKQAVLAMVRMGYKPGRPRTDVPVLGESALSALKLGIHLMQRAGYISEHDAHIGRKLAYILTGGDLSQPTKVSEQYLLDLEREAFLSLAGEPKTQERIMYMLQNGKPLRN
ncbi:MAG: enoyl-CoA hydratase/isomerase family protein [Acidobacteria bacterium]|nr:enoyl-CoA hydratase/isomerase family protein [Acidobacteriota bacterium]MBI3654930.1 enoyl-CoA hydratase/isomerase family protein [Acidobacteriota bacterium]